MCLGTVLIDIILRIETVSGHRRESVSRSPNILGGDTKRCEKKGWGETRDLVPRQNEGGDICVSPCKFSCDSLTHYRQSRWHTKHTDQTPLLTSGSTFPSANKNHSLEIWRTTNIHFTRPAPSYTFLLYISFPGWSFQSERLSSLFKVL